MEKLLLAYLIRKFGDDTKQVKHYKNLLDGLLSMISELAFEESDAQLKRKAPFKVLDRTDILLSSRDFDFSVQWNSPSEITRKVWTPDAKTLAAKIAQYLAYELDSDIVPGTNKLRGSDMEREIQALLTPSVLLDMVRELVKGKHVGRDTFYYSRIKAEDMILESEAFYTEPDYDEDVYSELPRGYDLSTSLIFLGFQTAKDGSLWEKCRADGEIRWA